MSLDDNVATYRHWLDEGWRRGNVDIVDELYSADYVSHSLGPDLPPTRDGLKTFVRTMRAGIPDLQVSVEQLVAEGDRVAGRLTMSGTHSGTLLGIPATGRRADIGVMLIARFDAGGRWTEDWVSWDQLGLLQQLGVIPAPAAV